MLRHKKLVSIMVAVAFMVMAVAPAAGATELMPKFNLPKLELPKFSLPSFQLPNIQFPKFTAPQLSKEVKAAIGELEKALKKLSGLVPGKDFTPDFKLVLAELEKAANQLKGVKLPAPDLANEFDKYASELKKAIEGLKSVTIPEFPMLPGQPDLALKEAMDKFVGAVKGIKDQLSQIKFPSPGTGTPGASPDVLGKFKKAVDQ